MKNQRCLILGANGFIGSHLVDELVAKGYQVRAFDRFLEGYVQNFNPSDQVEIFAGDIYSKEMLKQSLEDVDYVFHCFSATTPHSSDNDPATDVDKNLKPSIDIFASCVEAGIKKVVFVSSGGAIYGHLAEERAATESDAANPVSPYGINKLAIENYLAYFNRKSDLDYIVYRLTNPYGPRQQFRNSQGVIPAFLEKIESGDPIVVLGDGETSRDFVYIKDATRMMADSFEKETAHNIYNLGSGEQTTVNHIIAALQQVLGADFEIDHLPEPKTFLRSAKISNDRFISEFGEPKLTALSDGIQAMIDYRRS